MAQQIYNWGPEYFDIGSNQLELYRQGLKLIDTIHYTELSITHTRLLVTLSSGDLIEGIVRGRQVGGHPGLYSFQTQASDIPGGGSQLFTVPTYTTGNNSMRVWRMGKLLSLANGDYDEPNTTAVRVYGPLNTGDLFEFVIRGENADGEPILFEEHIAVGGVNEVFTLAGTYLIGTNTLEAFRLGKKLVITYGYDELTNQTIRYNGTSVAGDRFTFMVRAESSVFEDDPGCCP